MKILKKFLFYIIMIMTFALSFSSEDAKIYLDRKIEPAKLKIGVTKLKTKELPLDFNIEEKTIFGYLPDSVTDNHLIFISETLDEMPSLSTTNGRRSINNIKKYLTKDIKVAPKFTYQVLVGDKENGIEEGKKYLLMNCKTVLSGVYVYVVERDTYYVKEVYKGKFNLISMMAIIDNSIIKLDNPIVWYDYNSGVGGAGHDKRAHLLGNTVTTLTKDGSAFIKNNIWIEASGVPSYNWQDLGKHGVKIVKGTTDSKGNTTEGNYTLKATDENGKTKSSTFINLNSGNQVMFSYDGGRAELNFGISKYDFEETSGKVTIVHYPEGVLESDNPDSITTYNIDIPRFDGLPYVSENYDIKANEEYVKVCPASFRGELEYGRVGFKNLDTRITEQSGGEGIEIKAFKDVQLVPTINSENETITGVELYFKQNKGNAHYIEDSTEGITGIKGENEKETYRTLYLKIPENANLVPREKYKIERPTNIGTGASVDPSSLRIGVVVKKDEDKYFKEIAPLYLMVSELVGDTEVVFKNPMMRRTIGRGDLLIDKTANPKGTVESKGNHNTTYDSEQWWEITGAVDYPISEEDNTYYSYEVVGEGIEVENINGENKRVIFDGITLNLAIDYFGLRGKNYSSMYLGIQKIVDYQGEGIEKSFNIRWYVKESANYFREDKVKIKIESLDPTYYGKVFPTNYDDTSANNYKVTNNVGTGREVLKNNVIDEVAIDLGTTYRAYSRYDGIVNFLANKNWKFYADNEVIIKEKVTEGGANDSSNITGKIVFIPIDDTISNTNYLENVDVDMMADNVATTEKLPEKYAIKVLLTPENYNKLEAGKSYEIYNGDNSQNVLKIGDPNAVVGGNLLKRLDLAQPLNFTVSEGLEIETGILDFGKINLLAFKEETEVKRASTYVRVKGKTLHNISVTVQGVTENGTTNIYKLDSEGNQINDKYLPVTELKLEERIQEVSPTTRVDQIIGDYILTGALELNKSNTEIGNYEGKAVIEVTVIPE